MEDLLNLKQIALDNQSSTQLSQDETMRCFLCQQAYDDSLRVPLVIPVCGHTFCEVCLSHQISFLESQNPILCCPQDGIQFQLKQKSTKNLPKNKQLLQCLTQFSQMASSDSYEDHRNTQCFSNFDISAENFIFTKEEHILSPSNLADSMLLGQNSDSPRQQTLQVHTNSIEKISSDNSPQNSNFLLNSHSTKSANQCLIHNREYEIICMNCSVRICPNCALFGEHQAHDVKTEQDIFAQLTSKAENALELLHHIENLKRQIDPKLAFIKIQDQIQQKKQEIIQEILDKYNLIIEKLKESERKLIQSLNKKLENLEKDLKSESILPQNIENDTLIWQRYSQNVIAQLTEEIERGNIDLSILKSEGKNENLITKGQKLIHIIENFDTKVNDTVDKSIAKVHLQFINPNTNWFNFDLYSIKTASNQQKPISQYDEQFITITEESSNLNFLENSKRAQTFYYSHSNHNSNNNNYLETIQKAQADTMHHRNHFLNNAEVQRNHFERGAAIRVIPINMNNQILNDNPPNSSSSHTLMQQNSFNLLEDLNSPQFTTYNQRMNSQNLNNDNFEYLDKTLDLTNDLQIPQKIDGMGQSPLFLRDQDKTGTRSCNNIMSPPQTKEIFAQISKSPNMSRNPSPRVKIINVDENKQKIMTNSGDSKEECASVSSVNLVTQKLIYETQQGSRPSSKKQSNPIKVAEKFQPSVEDLRRGTNELVDLTGADVGDISMQAIGDLLKNNNSVQSLKLLQNKITDDGLAVLLQCVAQNSSLQSLNLSQNQLSDKAIDIIIINLETHPTLQNIILSQNKVNQRKVQAKVSELKKIGLTITL